jgi:RNA polymerase sigma-70 factor (ECF subfamily)
LPVTELEKIVNEHAGLVWKVCYRLVGNHADAEDCFQETFISAMDVIERQKIRSVKAMLARLATNKSIDLLRQRSRKTEAVSLEDSFEIAAGGCLPEQCFANKELGEKLRAALIQLADREAEAFCLRYLNEFDYGRIAAAIGVKRGNARVLVHRARAKLNQLLAGIVLDEDVEVSK